MEWFFEMPNWLYGILFGLPTLGVVLFLCRNEIREWYKSASEPNFWELARADVHKPSGLGWPESR